jgi:CheY-like chemotaxis protein
MNFSVPCAAFLPSPPVVCLAAESGGGARVLLVDDDPDSSVALCGWLECKGYDVVQASGPAEADERLAHATFDVILSDIHMPGNERLQWVERLLQRPGSPAIVLLTGNPEFETACRAANLSVAGYLVKPPDFNVVEELVGRIVTQHRDRAEFLTIAKDVIGLLDAHGANGLAQERVLVKRLAGLAHGFAGRFARLETETSPGDETWRTVITETIAVIEKTKQSFRSKELGALRVRLQRLLTGPKSTGEAAIEKKSKVPVRGDEMRAALRCALSATA